MVRENKWRTIEQIWLIAFTFSLILAWQANNNRISDIQKSRRESCIHTYEGIRQVFNQFKPKGPLPKKQENAWVKFNRIIDHRIAHCGIQTRTATTITTTK